MIYIIISIDNKLFGFIFSRSDEPILIGVCGMGSAYQDHRIVSQPIVSGSFLESGPGFLHHVVICSHDKDYNMDILYWLAYLITT